MTEHLETTEFEQFAQGALDASRLARFEAHASSCQACAAALMREARLELALVERSAARVARPWAQRGSRSRGVAAAILAVAAAAAAVLVVVRRHDAPPREAGIRSIAGVICLAGPEQAACVRRAHRHGLVVQYPDWAGLPPLGDHELELASGPAPRFAVGPSLPPFPSVAMVDL